MEKKIATFLVLFLSTLFSVYGDEEMGCYNRLEVDFFNEKFVAEALQLNHVYQSSWYLFNSALKVSAGAVPMMVQRRAEKMTPNPLRYPIQKREAALLLNQVLFEVFDKTVKEFGLTNLSSSAFNQNAIIDMFRYIRAKQSPRFVACFGEDIDKELENAPLYPSMSYRLP